VVIKRRIVLKGPGCRFECGWFEPLQIHPSSIGWVRYRLLKALTDLNSTTPAEVEALMRVRCRLFDPAVHIDRLFCLV